MNSSSVITPTKATAKKEKSSKKMVSKKEDIDAAQTSITKVSVPAITVIMEESKPKKTSHKKKATKLIVKEICPSVESESIGNIILHLNCSMEDLDNYKKHQFKDPLSYNPEIPLEIESFESTDRFANYKYETDADWKPNTAYQPYCLKCQENILTSKSQIPEPEPVSIKNEPAVHQKLKDIKISYFLDRVDLNKPSACFWCTCEFENSPCYIPQLETKEKMVVYGCFCTPECGAAFLFKENIDDTVKFERYHLLHKLYRNVSENIRPAPNPFYLLDKYLGNLTIQEYRQLLKSQTHSCLVMVDKPMTRLLPEIHTEGEAVLNVSTFKIKRPNEVGEPTVGPFVV